MKFSDFRVTSSFGWESVNGRHLTIEDTPLAAGNPTWARQGFVLGAESIKPSNAAGVQLPHKTYGLVFAMDGRTAVVRTTQNNLHIYDTWNKRQALIIPTPTGAGNSFGASERGFPPAGAPAAGDYDIDRYYRGRAIAVWHETESFAWLFIGEPGWAGTGGAAPLLGRLHIYTLDWSTDPPTYTATGTTLEPPLAEAGNHLMHVSGSYNNDYSRHWAAYGSAVAISADGSTLAVSAPRIHNTGAVYVYTRPDGAGRNWSDIAYEDGVKVTPSPVGHWGQSEATSTMPFSGQTCDAICIRQRANQWAKLGWRTVALSADGRVLAVGAAGTQYDDAAATPAPWGGTGGGNKIDAGRVYVFVAPEGGWQAAPDVVAGKTVLTAKQPAPADYSRATHITPGPNRRVTEPTHVLQPRTWANSDAQWHFGQFVTITRDGTTVAAATNGVSTWPGNPDNQGTKLAFIYQVNSPDDWGVATTARPNPWVGGVQISGFQGYAGPGWCGMAFDGPGTSLFLGECGWGAGNDPGALQILFRPADGRWVGGVGIDGTARARAAEPVGTRTGNGFGWPIYSLNGERLAVSTLGIKVVDHTCCSDNSGSPGETYFSDSGCYERRDGEGNVTTTCPLALGDAATIVVPPGQPDGPLTISGEITLFMSYGIRGDNVVGDDAANGRTITGTPLQLRIGAVGQLAEAKLDFAVDDRSTSAADDDRPYPNSLSSGERTVLRLQLLNENEMPAGADAIASIIATTTRGSLSSNVRDPDNARITNGCLGGGGDACQIQASLLTGDPEQARLFVFNDVTPTPGYRADNILLTLTHSGTGGPADVNVRVIAKDGTSLTPEAIRVNLLGPPAALSIAAPVGGLLNVGTPDAGVDADHRDRLTLAVTALDEHGAVVPLPSGGISRAWLTDPDGRRVARGVDIAWPLGGAAAPTLDAAGARQVRVDVNRAAAQPLANGEYTLSLRAGALSAEQTVRVSGGVAAVALSPAGLEAALDSDFTVTATLTDAEGDPVPDGTPVEWGEVSVVGSAGIVQRSAERVTGGGAASATWRAVSPGRVTVTAAANGLTAVALVTVPAPPQPTAAELLSSGAPNTFAIWNGRSAIRAAALLPELEGVTTLSIWRTGRWYRYGVDRGQLVEGSQNFQILPGNLLWLSD